MAAYDIVILPTADLAFKALDISAWLEARGVRFTLSKAGPFPHVSLYMVQLPDVAVSEAVARLPQIAGRTGSLTLTATDYSQSRGYLSVSYARLPSVDALQDQVITAINPLRDGLMEHDVERLQTATGVMRTNLEQYGYMYTKALFQPHLTLTRFTDENEVSTEGFPDPATLSGRFLELGLFELGDNGTCIRKVAGFALTG